MADPTLKDVLKAITQMQGGLAQVQSELANLDTKVEAHHAELKADIAAHRAETSAHRKETATGFDDLDEELARHSERTHRKLEARIERLEKRSPAKVTARMPRRRAR